MKLTNKLNLPQPIVEAVKNDGYTKGDADISVTELINPPQIRVLMGEHGHEVEEDVSDRIWSLCGQVVHGILERADQTGIAERRLSLVVAGWKISGGMDRFVLKEGLLQDYKFTTVYKVKGNKVPKEWEEQLNIYAEILRQNGDRVKTLQIVAILRDWSKGAAQRELNPEDYPKAQVQLIGIPLWDSVTARRHINSLVKEHQSADKGVVRQCTTEERWEKPSVYAVMKKGMKRAHRLCNTKEAAESLLATLGSQYYIDFRLGESTRCESYCSVAAFCPQRKKMLEQQTQEKTDEEK